MNFFKQTTLIGIGLIGSSIARALKKKKVTKKICIFSRTERTINKAKKLKLGNFYTNDLEKSVEGSDLIIICTPLSTYKKILDKLLELGMVHRIESMNSFVACRQEKCHGKNKEINLFTICKICGDVQELLSNGLKNIVKSLSKDNNFLLKCSVLELNGVCSKCKD